MRISDWSSDVCSSDLDVTHLALVQTRDAGDRRFVKGLHGARDEAVGQARIVENACGGVKPAKRPVSAGPASIQPLRGHSARTGPNSPARTESSHPFTTSAARPRDVSRCAPAESGRT